MKALLKNTPSLVIGIFAFLLVVILPLIYSNKTVDINLVPQFISVSILLAVSLILFFIFKINKTYSFYFNPVYIALACYLLFSFTSVFVSVNRIEGVFELLKTGTWLLLIIVMTQLLNDNKETKHILFSVFTISSFVLALIGLAQLTGIAFTKLPGQLIPYGTLGNRNIFVPSLLMTLPFAMYQMISQKGKWKGFSVLSVSLNGIVVIVSGMRTAWMALAVAAFAMAVVIVLVNKKYSFGFSVKVMRLLKVFIIVSALAAIAGMTVLIIHSSENRPKAGSVLSLSSTNERKALWGKSFEMFAAHPINGVGVGNWRIQLPNYSLAGLPREALVGEMHYQRPENDFIWVLAETGITGFISYLAIFIVAFYFLFKMMTRSAILQEKYQALLLFGALVLYAVIASFGFPKERTYLSVELAIVISLAVSGYQQIKSSDKKINIHPVFFLVFLAFCIYKGTTLYAGELQTEKLIEARTANQDDMVLKYADKAIEQHYLIDPTSTPIHFYKGVAYYNKGNIDSALANFELARKVHPYHLHVLNNLATCYETKGNHEEAIKCLKEAIRISPGFQDAMINLSAIYYNTGKISQAKEVIANCRINLKNAELNTLTKLIEKRMNDSIIRVLAQYFNSGNIQKASETIGKFKSRVKNPKVKEIKEAIINYKKDSVLKLAEKYYNQDSIKLAKLTLLRCPGCKSMPQYIRLRTEVDKRIGVRKKKN